MAMGYPYRPLRVAQHEIRLLCVNARVIKDDEPLGCYIEHASFSEDEPAPEYVAISYTWGDATQTRHIILDGLTVSVPENADIALRNLTKAALQLPSTEVKRKVSKDRPSEGQFRFWIDAVCINQSDPLERGQQVAIMWRIYSEAAVVLAWLGHDDGTTGAYIEQASKVLHHCRQATNNFEDLTSTIWQPYSGLSRTRLTPAPAPVDDWACVKSFYSVAWFQRLWIIQEVALARKAYAVRGDTIIPWPAVSLVACWLVYLCYGDKMNLGRLLLGIDNARSISQIFRVGTPLGAMLRYASSFKATDARDMFYGLLGIVKMSKYSSKGQKTDFVPDYLAPIHSVYANAVRMSIELDQDLGILSEAPLHTDDLADDSTADSFPSWVPRLHMDSDDEDSHPLRNPTSLAVATDSGGRSISPIMRPPDGNEDFTLSLKGLIVSIVKESLPIWSFNRQELQANMVACWDLSRDSANISLDTFTEIFVPSRWAEQTTHGKSITSLEWQAFIQWCLEGRSRDDLARPIEEYANVLHNRTWARHFFILQNGCTGIGPEPLRAGDVVCILLGGDLPFVLRPAEDRPGCFGLVGDAYVTGGVSDGSYIQKFQDQGTLESQCGWIDII